MTRLPLLNSTWSPWLLGMGGCFGLGGLVGFIFLKLPDLVAFGGAGILGFFYALAAVSLFREPKP